MISRDLRESFSICRMVVSNEYISFNAIAKQTPYRYSADATYIIRNVHDFCKREKEDGLKISLNQAKERASTATGVSKIMIEWIMNVDKAKQKTETTASQNVTGSARYIRLMGSTKDCQHPLL